jgi:endonuclease YncB( thermonuclease family)
MFRIMRRAIRIVRWLQWQPKHQRTPPVAPTHLGPTKQAARGTPEVLSSIESLPVARVMQVLDGDTLDVAIGPMEVRVRLDSIDCPEAGQPWGDTARYGFTKLFGGRSITLEVHGRDTHGRTLATIYVREANGSEWLNVNERMVMLGHAWVMRMYYDHLPKERQNQLNRLETWAKTKKVGLWKTENPTPPWKWRNGSPPQ